jgi:uncharacterized tellurite resistance protein B-like protein
VLRKLLENLSHTLSADPAGQSAEDRQAAVRLATAALMAEVARADHNFSGLEFDRIVDLAARHFGLDAKAATELANRADEKAEELVSLHELAQLLHAELDEDEKIDVVRLLWRIAYADGHLDKYEDALILKISDLLHVSRGAVMRLKYDARLEARH